MTTPAFFLPYKLPYDETLATALQIDVEILYVSKRTGESLDMRESVVVYINEDGEAWLEALTTAKKIQSYKASADHSLRQLVQTYADSRTIECEKLHFQIGSRGYSMNRDERNEFMDSLLPKLYREFESTRRLQLNLLCEI